MNYVPKCWHRCFYFCYCYASFWCWKAPIAKCNFDSQLPVMYSVGLWGCRRCLHLGDCWLSDKSWAACRRSHFAVGLASPGPQGYHHQCFWCSQSTFQHCPSHKRYWPHAALIPLVALLTHGWYSSNLLLNYGFIVAQYSESSSAYYTASSSTVLHNSTVQYHLSHYSCSSTFGSSWTAVNTLCSGSWRCFLWMTVLMI